MPAKPKGLSTSESVDDYLKAILELGGSGELRVTTKVLAERLRVRTPSVTGMLQRLALERPALVVYQKHRGVRLTAVGKRRAWELVRHHRLLELFLHDVLKYSWDEVHEEADRLEHFISERFEDRVAAILGDPEIDPHGHIIPQKYEAAAYRDEVPLAGWPLQTPAIISSVADRDPAALRELEQLGLRPGTVLTVERRNSASSLSVSITGGADAIRVSLDLADCISVIARAA
ncbi:MAG TPA: metal-dependent transcriptional regulator [Bryobacteraceae bacterium]|nr:metal-dependent transcriptional regulator [Bryobacteraceae bacterium]